MSQPSPTLLCSLGTSAAIVPEMFLLRDQMYRRIHIFTGESSRVKTADIFAFFAHYPNCEIRIFRLSGFHDLNDQKQHNLFTESLYRWYLRYLNRKTCDPLDICLSGGFKSMSASFQKAATLFGADAVLHALAEPQKVDGRDTFPTTPEEIQTAWTAQRLRLIEMDSEPGWPALRSLSPDDFPLHLEEGNSAGEWLINPVETPGICAEITRLQNQTASRADGWKKIALVPFSCLALLPPGRFAALQEPLNADSDRNWITTLPKIELHTHLGGFGTHGKDLAEIREAAENPPAKWPQEPPLPKGWPCPEKPVGLNPYRHLGDANGSALLSDPGCLRKHCEKLYAHLQRERVLYAEIRCSPANYTKQGHRPWEILEIIRHTFRTAMARAAQEDPSGGYPRISLIIIATRKHSGDLSDIARHLGLAVTAVTPDQDLDDCPVVGVDLAGFESMETRPRYFASSFESAHRCGLAVTAHAGENDDAESIWQAVHQLFARRLGHALHLQQAPDLMRTIRDRQIGIEMCPYANLQIKGFTPFHGKTHYPLRDYLKQGLKVSVNTDNIGISGAGLTENLLLLPRLCAGITRQEILQLQRNAIDTAFLPEPHRQRMLALWEKNLSAQGLPVA